MLFSPFSFLFQASFHIGIYNDNATTVNNAVTLWRAQAPAYLYMSSDGPSPKRPPIQPHLAYTGPVCGGAGMTRCYHPLS